MEIINFNNNLYTVYRKIREEHLKVIPNAVEDVKRVWLCDSALRKGEFIFFCRLIEDAIIVES
jgi:hypothetical protein